MIYLRIEFTDKEFNFECANCWLESSVLLRAVLRNGKQKLLTFYSSVIRNMEN